MARRGRVYDGFWRSLEVVGLKGARARWERQSPFLQRAVPPLVIAGLVILVTLPVRTPDPAALVLLGICYALYVLPGAWRRYALPLTVLAFALVYPLLIQQSDYQRFLFRLPIFNAFP